MTQLTILDSSGDRCLTCDPASPETLAEVQAEFDAMVAKGYAAFATGLDGVSERTSTFRTDVSEILMFKPGYGG